MGQHTWVSRTVPPLVFIGLVACVWYAIASRPEQAVGNSAVPHDVTAVTNSPHAQASQQPIANVTPTIQKQRGEVQFSLDPTPFKKVQKVEFYVEAKLVGAVFAVPFTVTVSENDLTAGTHTVTAKVYTGSTAAQTTTPVLFTANPTAPSRIDEDEDKTVKSAGPGSIANIQSTLNTPANLTAVAGTQGTSAQLNWDEVSGAISYQVWRDNQQIAAVSTPAYADPGLSTGQTYDYQVVAVNGNTVSDPSEQVAVTMPVPPPDMQLPVNTGQQYNPDDSIPPSPPDTVPES